MKKNQERRKGLTDELIRLLFVHIFGDPGPNLKGWDVLEFREIADEIRYGTSVRCSETRIGNPILRIPNVIGGVLNFEDLKYASLSKSEISRYGLKEGDILLVRTNGNREYVGRCAVFHSKAADDKINGDFGFASYLIRIRPKLDRVNPDFIKP